MLNVAKQNWAVSGSSGYTWVPSEGGADAIMTPSEALALNENPKAVPWPKPSGSPSSKYPSPLKLASRSGCNSKIGFITFQL